MSKLEVDEANGTTPARKHAYLGDLLPQEVEKAREETVLTA